MEINFDLEELKNYIKALLDPDEVYSVGIHRSSRNIRDFSKSVFEKGLTFERKEGVGLTGTVYMLGNSDYEDKIDKSIEELVIGTSNKQIGGGVVVAIPGCIKDEKGVDYFIGAYPDDLSYIAKDDKRLSYLPIENYSRVKENVPKEFILCSVDHDGKEVFLSPNPGFISNLSKEEQEEILKNMIDASPSKPEPLEQTKIFKKIYDMLEGGKSVSGRYLCDSAIQYEEKRNSKEKVR